MAEKEVRYWHS